MGEETIKEKIENCKAISQLINLDMEQVALTQATSAFISFVEVYKRILYDSRLDRIPLPSKKMINDLVEVCHDEMHLLCHIVNMVIDKEEG